MMAASRLSLVEWPYRGELDHVSSTIRRRRSFTSTDASALRHAARQTHSEHRTFTWLARHGHVAAHHARELAGDGEAEPGAAEAAVYEKIERTLASFLLVMAISAFMWSHFETALLTLLCQTTHDLLVPIESVSSWCLISRDTLKNSSFRSLPGGFVREVHLNIDVRRTGQPTSAPGSMTTEI